MVSSRLLIFQFAIFILTAQAVERPDFLYQVCIVEKGNYTANSTYEANFNDLLLSLSSITKIDHGFYNSSYGQNSDQVYGIGLCRGDVNADVCSGCLNNASSLLPESCPQQKEAIGWYDECMLRYSNRSILGVMETSPSFHMTTGNNVSANFVDQFNNDRRTLLERLGSQAAAGGPDLKFAAGNATARNSQTLYALVQCTPDLSEQECNNCLIEAFQGTPQCCDGKEGGRVLSPSCNFRFEVYPFYNATTAAAPLPSPSPSPSLTPSLKPDGRKSGASRISIIIVVLTVACTVLIFAGIFESVKGKCKKNRNEARNDTTIQLASLPVGASSVSSSAEISSSSEQLPKLMDKRNGNAPNKDKLKKIWKKPSTMYRLGKKKDEFVVTPINKENEIQELMPQPMLKSDAVMPSSSTSELDEYKWRCEEAEREVHIQREKISSLCNEMQEEVNSKKRQQTQQQQEMEAKQRQMEQQIEFLLSQLQLRRDPPPP